MFLLSPPTRWCGLKVTIIAVLLWWMQVTTYAVVWIERPRLRACMLGTKRHHLRGGVDWKVLTLFSEDTVWRHHLRGGVDWKNNKYFFDLVLLRSPPTRWCGLKDTLVLPTIGDVFVTTYAVVWIERPQPGQPPSLRTSPPTRWCGLKDQDKSPI